MKFKIKYRIKDNFFTRTVKLTFSIMMNLMINKSNKSIQNSLNDIKLNGNIDCTITNSEYNRFKEFSKEIMQSRVSVLYDVKNNITLHSTINNACKNNDNNLVVKGERILALEHLKHSTKEDLVTFDRGYQSYELFVHYDAITNFICRMTSVSFEKTKFLFLEDCKVNDIVLSIDAPKNVKLKLKEQKLP